MAKSAGVPVTVITYYGALARSTTAEWKSEGVRMRTSSSVALEDYRRAMPPMAAKRRSHALVSEEEYTEDVVHALGADMASAVLFVLRTIGEIPQHIDGSTRAALLGIMDPAGEFPFYTHLVYSKWMSWFPVNRPFALLIVDEYQVCVPE